MVASIAATERRSVATIDFPGAYLNAELKEEVFMRIERRLVKVLTDLAPDDYKDYISPQGDLIVKLKKALYGLGESAKLWNELLSEELEELGFTANRKDRCVFNKTINDVQMTVLVYVDDLLITCADKASIGVLFDSLAKRYPGLKMNSGPVISYLGQTFDFSVAERCKVTMGGYIKEVLKDYEVEGHAVSPAGSDLFTVGGGSKISKELTDAFHSRVAKLFYLAKRVRPDILTAVAWLATRVRDPTSTDWDKLSRVLKYLRATPDEELILGGGTTLTAYIDASYGVHEDAKSHTGVVIKLGKGTIHVCSRKQKINSKSSTEAELIALSDGLTPVIWAREFLLEQGYEGREAIIYQDNKSTILLAKKGYADSERTKHINARYFWITDRIKCGEVIVEHLGTDRMLADLLTKPIQGELFRRLRGGVLAGDIL